MTASHDSGIRVSDLMEPLRGTAHPSMTLSEGLALLAQEPTHEVPVVAEGRLRGMLCYRVLLERRRLASSAHVDTLLLHPPRVTPRTRVEVATRRMLDGNFRLLPVVEQGEVVGLVSRLGVLAQLKAWLTASPLCVEEVMALNVEGVRPSDALARARALLRRQDLIELPVLKGKRLLGVVGTSDLIQRGRADHQGRLRLEGERFPVGSRIEHLLRQPVTVVGETDLEAAAALMLDQKIASLIVTRGERFEGVLTARHLLEAALASRQPQQGAHVQVTGLSEEDPWQAGQLMERLHQALQRLHRREAVLSLTLHVSQNRSGEYQLRGQLRTARRTLAGSGSDWELLNAARQFTEGLETRLRRKAHR